MENKNNKFETISDISESRNPGNLIQPETNYPISASNQISGSETPVPQVSSKTIVNSFSTTADPNIMLQDKNNLEVDSSSLSSHSPEKYYFLFKIFVAFTWLALIFSIFLTVIAVTSSDEQQSGAGWILLISVPGIIGSVICLIIIYITRWISKIKFSKSSESGNYSRFSKNHYILYATLCFAINIATYVGLIALYSLAGKGLIEISPIYTWTLVIIGGVNNLLGVIGASIISKKSLPLNNKTRFVVFSFFLSGIWLSALLMPVLKTASPLLYSDFKTYSANKVMRLDYNPLVPSNTNDYILSPWSEAYVDEKGLLTVTVIRNLPEKSDLRSTKIALQIMKAEAKNSENPVVRCNGKCKANFITDKGTRIDYYNPGYGEPFRYFFEKDGVYVQMYEREGRSVNTAIENDSFIQNNSTYEQANYKVGQFVDQLKPVKSSELSDKYY